MQNTSPAVMAQRAEPPDSLDFFPTPPWAARALCEHVIDLHGRTVWEPACGAGHMARALQEYTLSVHASDVHDYGYGSKWDFLWRHFADDPTFDWVITNPPFRLGQQFIERALDIAGEGVAMLVRSAFIESIARYEGLFRDRPPAIAAQFVERVPMVKGRCDPNASTATAYLWLVWRKGWSLPTHLQWIPPCRAKLERNGDYL